MKKYFLYILIMALSLNVFSQKNKATENYFLALNFLENNEIDSAISKIKNNNDEKSLLLLSKIYLKKEEINLAIKTLTNEVNKNSNKNLLFELAKIYADLEFEDEAINFLSRYFENNTEPLYYFQIIQEKEFQKIENCYSWRIFWETNHYNKHYLDFEEILILQNNKKYDEAQEKLNQIQENSFSYLKNYYLAKNYYYNNEIKKANSFINLSAKQNPKNEETQKLKIKIEKIQKKYLQAISSIETLNKINNYNKEIIFEKAEIYYLLANYEKAKAEILYYLKFFTNDKKALLLKSKIDIALNQKDDALLSLNKIIISDNKLNQEAYLLRADIFFDFGSWDLAQKDYSMSLDINPKDGEVLYKYGICWLNLGMQEKACHSLKKALQIRYKKAQREYFKNCE